MKDKYDPGTMDLIDLIEARRLRDEGMESALENSGEWKDLAGLFIATLKGFEGTGEDLRLMITAKIGKPHHHNAWGGVINGAKRKGYLITVGTGQMKTPKSHARSTAIYRTRDII